MLVAAVVLFAALTMMLIEHRTPARALPRVHGWWPRTLALNAFQALCVWGLGRVLEPGLHEIAGEGYAFIRDGGPVWGAAIGYLAITFVYYFWHRARHEVPVLWRWFHQVHHSVSRIEVAASFYKHPFEIVANAFISGTLLFVVLRLDAESAAGATLLGGLAELFYHWNVRTPRWLGYFFQRPEMHRVHHREGHHRSNYADLPIWDILFGTFENPRGADEPTGFGQGRERQLGAMLLGERVDEGHAPRPGRRRALLLLVLGLLGMSSDAFGLSKMAGLAAATGASPAPKVFTRVGDVEPFSARFSLRYTDRDGVVRTIELDAARYRGLRGPYNRRNVFGALIAAGPELRDHALLAPMADSALRYALCDDAPLLEELGLLDARDPVLVRTLDNGEVQLSEASCE